MTTLTNAELAAAIEWVYGKLAAAHTSSTLNFAENSFMYTHLNELLRIQRERAAAKPELRNPINPLPVLEMTPAENLHLWMTNRAAWIEAAAPKCAEYLATGRAAIEHAWPILARDYQLKVWPLLDEATRALIKEIRE